MRRHIALLSAFLVLAGCTSTPDLSKWAQGSAALSSAVAEDNRDTLGQIDVTIESMKTGQQEGWKTLDGHASLKIWKDRRQSYYEGAAIVNASMEAMVKYANSVSDLAAAGETGREASENLITSAKSIFETAGAAFPGGSAAGAAVGAALQEIADIVTRVQAQDRLADTMSELNAAVDALAGKIGDYTNKQRDVISKIAQLREATVRGQFGVDRVGWSKRKNTYREIERLFRNGDAVKTLATLELLDRETEHVRARDKKVFEVRKWRDESKQKLKEISAAAKVWANAHREAADLLAKCGGLQSMNFKCGNYSAANLLQAKTRIENVITAYK